MTMKKVLFISIIYFFLTGCASQKKTSALVDDKIRDCPEVMIDNRMPQIIDENSELNVPPGKYYIYKGERHEIAEFDTAWINRNCDVEVQVVY